MNRNIVEGGGTSWAIPSGSLLPRTWVLLDDRPGNSTQSMGLIEALGWPYELKNLRFLSPFKSRSWYIPPMINCVDFGHSTSLSPPWPDLIIAAGQRTAPVAKWIKRQNQGITRVVQLGRKSGLVMDELDLVVTPRYCQLPPHPNRLITTFSLNRITPEKLKKAAAEGSRIMQEAQQPRIVCLIGGATPRYRLDDPVARQMGEDFLQLAKELGGSVFAVTSRRTGESVTRILQEHLSGVGQVFAWNPQENLLPYVTALAMADVLIVTGESEAMLAEAAATDKPMRIYPLPKKSPTFLQGLNPFRRIKRWLLEHSHLPVTEVEESKAGFQPLRDICTWFFSRGYYHPARRLECLHQDLFSLGIAKRFGEPVDDQVRQPFNETPRVASHIQQLFGVRHGG